MLTKFKTFGIQDFHNSCFKFAISILNWKGQTFCIHNKQDLEIGKFWAFCNFSDFVQNFCPCMFCPPVNCWVQNQQQMLNLCKEIFFEFVFVFVFFRTILTSHVFVRSSKLLGAKSEALRESNRASFYLQHFSTSQLFNILKNDRPRDDGTLRRV